MNITAVNTGGDNLYNKARTFGKNVANTSSAGLKGDLNGTVPASQTGIALTQTGGTGGTGRGAGGSSSADIYGGAGYLDYLSAAMAARQEAMARANEALDQQGKAIEQRYNNQLNKVGEDYQKLKNQSELNRYKAMRNLRETQANRGLLNSGAGRQESLNLNTTYGNNLNEIGLAEQNERAQIQQAINEMWANIAAQKAANEANITGDFTSSLISALSNGLYSYSPQLSEYYQAAQGAAGNAWLPTSAVNNGQVASLTPVQAMALYDPQFQANYLNKINQGNYNIYK